jgi:Leucine-rich repeat (LRR) protein
MQTLTQLLSGELKGTKTLKLSCELKGFPNEIFDLAETLEILDLSGNQLSQLPDNFNDLKKLKIAFFSDNNFIKFPEVLAKCESLTMIGFKSNKIEFISEHAFPINLQWLILTNNCINQLPKSIGNCLKLQKVALAGNKLRSLPNEMSQCKNIELLRISANQISEFPEWLFELPRLSWLAFSGNPICTTAPIIFELPVIEWNELYIKETLGQGASGIISKAEWTCNSTKKEIAVKVFKGEVTSDGFPEDEMNACILAGHHKNLVTVIGKIKNHPEQKRGLVLELIPTNFKNLAGPPSFNTCTRDTFQLGANFSISTILNIVKAIANAMHHLHSKGIMHGDLYAHNTLIDEYANTIFGDFGAATVYDITNKTSTYFERIDVRAFGCFIEDLLNQNFEKENSLKQSLIQLKNDCMQDSILKRPSFEEINQRLYSIS